MIKRHTRRKFTRYGHRVEKAYVAKYGTQTAFILEGLHRETRYHSTLNSVLCGERPGTELKKQIANVLGVTD